MSVATGPVADILERLAAERLNDGRSWLDVAREEAQARGLDVLDVVGPSHARTPTAARHAAWYRIFVEGPSYREIGRAWGREHSAVFKGIQVHERHTAR